MSEYEWKQYAQSTKVTNAAAARLSVVIDIANEELQHQLNYGIFSNGYRRYRRGKNRCSRCGVKLDV